MNLELLVDLHKGQLRQGPGDDAACLRALELAGLSGKRNLQIADIGCGTGAASLYLAAQLDAQITAIDFLPEFLSVLSERAKAAGLSDKITCQAQDMQELQFAENSFDVIWSEGAIYNMGFANGIAAWKRFLKPGGIMALSEITWLNAQRPQALTDFWQAEYAEIGLASEKISVLENNGLQLLGYFPLWQDCWMKNYYAPLQAAFAGFLERHAHSEAAQAIVQENKAEIALYEENHKFFSYGFYIALKLG